VKDAEAAAAAQLIAQRKAEREERKRQRAAAKAAAQEEARKAAEAMVLGDVWTQEQQHAFELALLTYTSSMEKNERWTKVAAAVGNKTKNQCLMRYRYLKEYVIKMISIEKTAAVGEMNEMYMNLQLIS
jgi:hypothetical protein